MKKITAFLLFITSLSLNILPVNAAKNADVWPEGPKVSAKSAIVMEASTGLILYEKNIHKKNYPASTTKLMTTLLALENSSMDDVLTFSRDSVFNIERGSSHIGIDVGEKLTMENSLYGIMLASANEVSYAVAEHVSGSIDSFATLMNERAKELGCETTHFINPHGLYDENHYTSAYDLALISKELLKYDSFREITSTTNYVVPPTNLQKESRPIYNHHKMVRNTSYHYDGAFGGKTGYTQKARYSLATFASRDNMDLICIIMNEENGQAQYTDTKKLLDFGFSNYTAYKITDNEDIKTFEDLSLFSKFNSLFDKETSPLKISNKGIVILPNSVDFSKTNRSIKYTPGSKLEDGINTIGNVSYEYDGKIVGQADILYNNSDTLKLAKATITYDEGLTIKEHLEKNQKIIIIGGIVFVFLLIGLLHYFLAERIRRKHRRYYAIRRKRTRDSFDQDFTDL